MQPYINRSYMNKEIVDSIYSPTFTKVLIDMNPAMGIFFKTFIRPHIHILTKGDISANQYIANDIYQNVLVFILDNMYVEFDQFLKIISNDFNPNTMSVSNVLNNNPYLLNLLKEEISRLAIHIWFTLKELNLLRRDSVYIYDTFNTDTLVFLLTGEELQ